MPVPPPQCRSNYVIAEFFFLLTCDLWTCDLRPVTCLLYLADKMGLTGLHDSLVHACICFSLFQPLAVTRISLTDLPLLYEMRGGSWLVL